MQPQKGGILVLPHPSQADIAHMQVALSERLTGHKLRAEDLWSIWLELPTFERTSTQCEPGGACGHEDGGLWAV